MRHPALLLVALLAACGDHRTRVDQIEVGMCFDDQEGAEIEHLPEVPCDEPHENEVFHLYERTDGEHPGEELLRAEADAVCRGEVFTAYVGEPVETSRFEVYQILPTEESWRRGDREVVCVLYDPEDNIETGSARLAPT